MSVVYIDPSVAGPGSGSFADPYKAWSSVTWAAGNVYLQKENTTSTAQITVGASGSSAQSPIKIGAYDKDTGAQIVDPQRFAKLDGLSAIEQGIYCINRSNLDISNFEIMNIARISANPNGIYTTGGSQVAVRRCKIHDIFGSQSSGIKTNTTTYLTVTENEVYNCDEDGIWLGAGPFFVTYNYVHDVDKGGFAGGDCLQAYGTLGAFLIAYNRFDHSNSNNKQTIIVQDTGSSVGGTIARNWLKGGNPDSAYASANRHKTLYIDQAGALVYGNYVEGGEYAIFASGGVATGIRIVGNLILQYGLNSLIGISHAVNNSKVLNNTVVRILSDLTTVQSRGIEQSSSGVTGSQCKNNIVIGYQIGLRQGVYSTAAVEYNSVYGCTTPLADASFVSRTLDAHSLITDPQLDSTYKPKAVLPLTIGSQLSDGFSRSAEVTADTTIWMGSATLESVTCNSGGVLASIYDSSTGSGSALLSSTTGTNGVTYLPTDTSADNGIHADWTSGTWTVKYRANEQVYTVQPYSGFRTILSDNSSSFISNTGSKKRQQVFAGPNSVGLLDPLSGAALPMSVQFGTGATDGIPNTSFTATPPNTASTGMESGGSSAAPCLVEIDGSSNQSMGYGRVTWNATTKALRMLQKADDALVSSNPRCQLYAHRCLNRTAAFRFYLEFQLGDDITAWPALVANKNTVLIFQLKGSSSYPPFDVQVREAASGNSATRDLYFLRRLSNSVTGGFDNQGQNRVLVVYDIPLKQRLNFAIDFVPDWRDGYGFISILRDGVVQQLHADVGGQLYYTGRTLYTSATPDSVSAMWGIYRPNYSSAKAPDDCAITFYRAEVVIKPQPTARSPVISAGVHLGYQADKLGNQFKNPPSMGAFELFTTRTAISTSRASRA